MFSDNGSCHIFFLTSSDNRLDIVPVDWVAAVISDIMVKDVYHQVFNEKGELVKKGYYKKNFKDTLDTGWGGLVDFERLEKKTANYMAPQTAYSTSRK